MEQNVKGKKSDPWSTDGVDESDSYEAYLFKEREEAAQHYLKPFRKKFQVCWILLALALVTSFVNLGLGMLLALPPVIYLRAVYATAYSPNQMGISRGQSFSMLFIEVPLAILYFSVALGFL